ncbi:MAG: 4-(cytidine 5'-diphospho)-2-C-methyl-D-erythritol kinase [Candidatus Eremiobacteraeota bacterium]|nr:4-(cytidine 5'-diphospho)-2-C-methyl-D-erythritol kinase [Candidatus Eremiobacteraeota bacterium]
MGPSVVLRAPAKLNLTLEVLGQRDDGYHNLRSVMVPVSLYDEITIGGEGEPGIDPQNLVHKSLRALQLPGSMPAVALHKNIPMGAGLGGGSSDAATILLAAMDGAFGPLESKDYVQIARSLGSDVPFFLTGTACIVEGTGERVTALGGVPPWHATIVRPPVHVSTASAYAALDLRPGPARPRNTSVTLALGEALQRAEFSHVVDLLQNDFQDRIAAQYPQVATAAAALKAWSGSRPLLTGSGSCVFTLWSDGPPAAGLELPAGYERYDVTFVNSSHWRGPQ